ncbi:MAG TPA: hypothetical protein GX534_06770 [Thermoanaerobacterales bacterium]|nr:hypothetical protein [Thermoanaerobacterales bacterium]
MSILEDVLNKGLAAMVPIYENGNVTRLVVSNGSDMIDQRTCRTVLKNIAYIYGTDLASVRRCYGLAINKKNSVPLPLAVNLVLIPVKMRKNPLGKSDGTLGYVNFKEIDKVKYTDDKGCDVLLKSGSMIHVLVSSVTMKDYMKNAQIVENVYVDRHFKVSTRNSSALQVKEECNSHVNKTGYVCDEAYFRRYLLELLREILKLQKGQAQ